MEILFPSIDGDVQEDAPWGIVYINVKEHLKTYRFKYSVLLPFNHLKSISAAISELQHPT
jgi:hypothetical protein